MTRPVAPTTGIEVLGTVQHASWAERVLPPVEQLTGWLWSVPVPIPHNPLRYTLSHVLLGDDGPVVVDPGWDTDEGWDALTAGLAAAGAVPHEVVGIVATHVHPDHHGLSRRLRDASGAWVAMHPAERDTLPQRTCTADPADRRRVAARWLAAAGAPADDTADLLAPFDDEQADRMGGMVEPDVLLDDGDLVPVRGHEVRALWTPGHTPGHLCFRVPAAALLLTGDHVLPRITPNIGLAPDTDRPALDDFLASLEKVAAYDDHDALPAHEYRFRGLAARAGELLEHHERRCAEIVDVVAELGAPTLWQLAEHLTWARPWAEVGAMRFGAVAETAAHATYLEARSVLVHRTRGTTTRVELSDAGHEPRHHSPRPIAD